MNYRFWYRSPDASWVECSERRYWSVVECLYGADELVAELSGWAVAVGGMEFSL